MFPMWFKTGSSAVDGNFTIYANPYAVVRKNQYTKHYFLGTQRILTKIGSNSVEKTFYEGYANAQVTGVDYEGKQSALEGKITLDNKLLNVGWYRETRGRVPSPYIKHYLRAKEHGGLSGANPWNGADNTVDDEQSQNVEDKQYYYHPDHLGSTNYLTDVTGEAYQHVAYLPWGEVFVEQRNTQSSRNTFLYTGKELDEETGLYYVEQRYYDALKSTFLGVDPLLDKFPEWGAYTYTFNNPIKFIDPEGMSPSNPQSPFNPTKSTTNPVNRIIQANVARGEMISNIKNKVTNTLMSNYVNNVNSNISESEYGVISAKVFSRIGVSFSDGEMNVHIDGSVGSKGSGALDKIKEIGGDQVKDVVKDIVIDRALEKGVEKKIISVATKGALKHGINVLGVMTKVMHTTETADTSTEPMLEFKAASVVRTGILSEKTSEKIVKIIQSELQILNSKLNEE